MTVPDYAPMVASVEMDGNIRTCTMHDGSIVKEEIVSTDEENMTVVIRFAESNMPMENFEAKMAVKDNGDGTCDAVWTAGFSVAKGGGEMMKTNMEGMQMMMLGELKKKHMTYTEHMATLNVASKDLWATLSQFSGIHDWHPMIASSTIEGEGVGATRTCTMPDGGELIETLLAVDEENMKMTYNITSSPLPVSGYEGTMAVKDLGDGTSELHWSSVFAVPDEAKEEILATMDMVYKTGFEGLEKMLAVQ